MPDLQPQGFPTQDPGVFDYTRLGTAAGTTVISTRPCVFGGILVDARVASATFIIYDSPTGTSGTVLGTVTLGTNASNDPAGWPYPPIRMKNGLTIANSANQGGAALFK